MAKTKSQYVCSSCGYQSPRWVGKCPECNEWNTFIEEVAATEQKSRGAGIKAFGIEQSATRPLNLKEITHTDEDRIPTGIDELDRVLGGGIMRGSMVLVGGDPGIGKSTLLLQMARNMLTSKTLYVSGEESPRQLKSRAERIGMKNEDISFFAETDIERIIEQSDTDRPDVLIIDSIQTMYRPSMESIPGSVSQVRECASLLLQFAKTRNIPVFIVGHVTKEGSIAGPKVLEHIVDAVLQFEGERTHAYRILRAMKNRYGSTNEIGVFSMTSDGLQEVPNPSEVFLSERQYGASGSVVCCVLEGTRPVLLEVQALVSPTHYNSPQRTVTGYDYRRVAMLLAVIEKKLGVRLSQQDVFINIAGGITVDEPAVDLAICIAILSSVKDIPVDSGTCFIGEVGLAGEVRAIPQADVRVQEAAKLGFTNLIAPGASMKSVGKTKIKIHSVRTLAEAEKIAL